MIDLSKVTGLADSVRGGITQIADASGRVIWSKVVSYPEGTAVLKVKKITSNTYAGENTYNGEQFILLNIYPKTNGTVSVTYGGLTKTITDTSGAAEPNAQKVYFGKFNGVSDSVTTPMSGTLTISGEYRGFGVGSYESSKVNIGYYSGLIEVVDFAASEMIPSGAFRSSTSLTTIVIPSNITAIPASAFRDCTNLVSVTLPSNITTIDMYAFENCTSLTTFTVPSGLYRIMNDTFSGCSSLTTLIIPAGLRDLINSPFGGCVNLVNFIVDANNPNFSSSGSMLVSKDKTTIVAYPSASGHYTVPSNITSIASYAFYGNPVLESITISSSVRTLGLNTFTNCTNLKSVVLSTGITALGDRVFSDCVNLTNITIPSSITSMGNRAFYLTEGNTRTVTMLSATPPKLAVDTVFDEIGTHNFIVPAGSGATYKAAEYWSEYADYITEAE